MICIVLYVVSEIEMLLNKNEISSKLTSIMALPMPLWNTIVMIIVVILARIINKCQRAPNVSGLIAIISINRTHVITSTICSITTFDILSSDRICNAEIITSILSVNFFFEIIICIFTIRSTLSICDLFLLVPILLFYMHSRCIWNTLRFGNCKYLISFQKTMFISS